MMKTKYKTVFYNNYSVQIINKKLFPFISLLLLLFTVQLFAQPTNGGGGLIIDNLFNNKLEKLNILDSNSVKIRNFVLEGKKVITEILPASLQLSPVNIYSHQRMYIIYKKQAMVIDFIGMIRPNNEHYIDIMDSLVFQKGYFKYDFSKKESSSLNYKNSKIIENRLTLQNKTQLIREGKLEYNPTIDFSFLSDQNPPALPYFKEAANYLKKNQTELALAELKKGIKINKNPENCEILYLLCDIYSKTGQYEKAIENISKAINLKCRRDYKVDSYYENTTANYKKRIELFIKLKKYDQALQDYDTLYSILKLKSGNYEAYLDRANFKLKYLKDYTGVIDDIKMRIDESKIEQYHKDALLHGYFENYELYTVLAKAEYLKEDKQIAYRYWLKAAECGYQNNPFINVTDLDSIINQNPKVPELYLARALVNYNRGNFLSLSNRDIRSGTYNFKAAFNDIAKAEEFGITDYRINMYRAIVLSQLERDDEALKEINIAILKNNQNPRSFWFRQSIRYDLGQIKEQFEENDPDYKQYQMLLQDWKWEKY